MPILEILFNSGICQPPLLFLTTMKQRVTGGMVQKHLYLSSRGFFLAHQSVINHSLILSLVFFS
jgi:hypothetical protein